ncbi:hypothetical protein IJ22_46750 [Paenibacillus naphthalenovorans]|uniref:Uncharacterized protein n=1 Tax=Paenibacillus naphthalenovorans TaxID=162209 RepID=A0A0U2UF82_9BACL|nr:hypothetical protein IJ22_46750 [Paenibacillus naphthalenovorans]
MPDHLFGFIFWKGVGGEGEREKGLINQAWSQYTLPLCPFPYPCPLVPSNISLDISQRSVFVLPFNFHYLISSNFADTFYFLPILYQLVPQIPKTLVRQGIGGFGGAKVGWT